MNEVDVRWEKYLLSRSKDHYLEVVECASADLMATSSYFGDLYNALSDFFFSSFCCGQKPNQEFLQKINVQPNTKRALLGEVLSDSLDFKDVQYSDLNQQDFSSLSFAGVDVGRLAEFVNIFEVSSEEKLQLLMNGGLPNFFSRDGYFLLSGTFVFDGCFIGVQADKSLVFLISLQSPIDAVFFPRTGLIIKSKNLGYEVVSRAKKLIKNIPRNVSEYSRWNPTASGKTFVNLIRDKRPYHVIADEISGHHFLKGASPNSRFSVAFLERASFVETSAFAADVIPNEALQEYAEDKIVFSSYNRVGVDAFYEDYRNYLIRLAEEMYGPEVLSFEKGAKVFWIGIAGGEKRAWLEETDGLEKVIGWIKARFDNCRFVFDGWTVNQYPSDADRKNILNHEAIMHKLIARCGLGEGTYLNLIGSQILRKIAFAKQSIFFVACAGTPAFWPSKVCKVPGFVHNSKQMINRVDNTMNISNITKMSLEKIVDKTEDMMVNRWDYVSYSIKPDEFLLEFSEALSKYSEVK